MYVYAIFKRFRINIVLSLIILFCLNYSHYVSEIQYKSSVIQVGSSASCKPNLVQPFLREMHGENVSTGLGV